MIQQTRAFARQRADALLSDMKTAKEYAEIINRTLDDIKYPTTPAGLYEPIRYALEGGGKRLRPTLLLAMNDAFGGETSDAIWPAAGVEIFHNFTLVHDDVMDNADMRRGRLTVWKKWDVNTAILSGDAMTTMAYQCMSACEPQYLPEVINRYSMMTMNVYEGQQIDSEFETRDNVDFNDYIRMIIGKTSALIAYPCAIGALIAGASEKDVEAVFNFGVSLGIAFQMQDDYLDVYGDPVTFGKEIGGDIVNDKKTWLYIIAQDSDNDGEFRALLSTPMEYAEKIAKVTAHFDKLNLREEGQKIIGQYTSDALEYLDTTSMSDEAKRWFREYAQKLIGRNK